MYPKFFSIHVPTKTKAGEVIMKEERGDLTCYIIAHKKLMSEEALNAAMKAGPQKPASTTVSDRKPAATVSDKKTPRKSAAIASNKKAPCKSAAAASNGDQSDEESDEEEEVMPKKAPRKSAAVVSNKKAPRKSAASASNGDHSDEESDDEELSKKKRKTKKKPPTKAVAANWGGSTTRHPGDCKPPRATKGNQSRKRKVDSNEPTDVVSEKKPTRKRKENSIEPKKRTSLHLDALKLWFNRTYTYA